MNSVDNEEGLTTKQPSHNDLTWLNQSKRVVEVIGSYKVAKYEDMVLCQSTTTIQLPLASRGRELTILKQFAGSTVSINTATGDTIKGVTTLSLSTQWSSITIKAYINKWLVIASHL